VSLKGEKNWVYALTQEPVGSRPVGRAFTEGMKDKWAQGKALEYMRAHPGTTIRRAAIKLSDFWGLERSFIAGVQQGLYNPPRWFGVVAAILILSTYAGVALSSAVGIWLVRPEWRQHLLLLLPIVVIMGVHAIVFGHPRYHVPLIPILAVYAAAVWHQGPVRIWRLQRPAAGMAAVLSLLLLVSAWARQIFLVDGERVRGFLSTLW
jgi:hypothetical protein